MRFGEIATEAGWLVVIVLVLPVLVPLGLFAAVLVLHERLAGGNRRQTRTLQIGHPAKPSSQSVDASSG
jgi:hypothetical protein